MSEWQFVTIQALNATAREMLDIYGNKLRVGKIGAENVMFVNDSCTSIEDDSFLWGFWLNKDAFKQIS